MLTFAAVIFFIVLIEDVSCHVCRIDKHEISADCSNSRLLFVPGDLSKSIRSLDLSKNKISILETKAFVKYSNLINLTIDDNELIHLENDCFIGLGMLQVLRMKTNHLNIESSYKDVFKHLKKLVILDIRRNVKHPGTERSVYYPNFGYMKNLTALYMDLMHIPNFSKSELRKLKNLKFVRFSHCYLRDMKNNTFEDLPNSIEYIYFGSCTNVKTVEIAFLRPFSNLQSLQMYQTYIHLSQALELLYPFQNKAMKTIAFTEVNIEYKGSIESPVIEYPASVIVTKDMMKYLKTICVETLVLSDNGIVDFHVESLLSYNHPDCFREIGFVGNRFSLVSGTKEFEMKFLLSSFSNLKTFEFSFNPILFSNITYIKTQSEYPYVTADEYNRLSNLKLPNNSTSINTQLCETATSFLFILPPNLEVLRLTHFFFQLDTEIEICIKNARSLKYLDLSYFQMQIFPYVDFDRSNNLHHLDLTGIDSSLYAKSKKVPFCPKLKTLIARDGKMHRAFTENKGFLAFVPNIEELDLSSNSLWFFPSEAFALTNLKLKRLTLQSNLLKQVPTAITELQNLQFLDISLNYIQSINKKMRNWFDLHSQKTTFKFKLAISGNNFVCSCDNKYFVKWIVETVVHLDRKHRNYSCVLGNGTESDTLRVYQDFTNVFRHCYQHNWIKILIILLSVITGSILVFAPLYRFRWQIAFSVYRRIKPLVENKLDKQYENDIYLSHGELTTELKNLTCGRLTEKIRSLGLERIYIRDDDLTPGRNVLEEILEIIAKSRHVIFLIASEYSEVEVRFLRAEIQYSLDAKFSNSLEKISVIYKDIDIRNVPNDLNELLDKLPFIHKIDLSSDSEASWTQLTLALLK